ncbi:hypothetical protein STEG23_031033, partial [Scotinomys teguina]
MDDAEALLKRSMPEWESILNDCEGHASADDSMPGIFESFPKGSCHLEAEDKIFLISEDSDGNELIRGSDLDQ